MAGDELLRVERLTRRKKGRPGEEIEVHLSDASSFFVSMRVWEERPFHEGDTLTPRDIDTISRSSALISARHRALSLLARSEHSAFLLRRKLIRKGLDESIVETVITDLRADGSLDDARFSLSWVRDRLRRHPEARVALLAGLSGRGVDSATAETAVDRVLEEEEISMEDVAEELARKALSSGNRTARSVATMLMRRGFPPGLVRRILTEITGEDPISEKRSGDA